MPVTTLWLVASQTAYDVLVVAHAVSAVVGFGAVAVSGAYGVIGRSGESEEVRRFFSGRARAEWLVIAVPLFGVAALSARPGGADYSSVWVVTGLGVWLLAATLLFLVVRPAQAAVRGGLARSADIRRASGRLAWAAAACDLLFVVAVFVMVTQPR